MDTQEGGGGGEGDDGERAIGTGRGGKGWAEQSTAGCHWCGARSEDRDGGDGEWGIANGMEWMPQSNPIRIPVDCALTMRGAIRCEREKGGEILERVVLIRFLGLARSLVGGVLQ